MKENRNVIIASVLVIALIFLWVNVNMVENKDQKENNLQNQYHSDVRLSNLPGNLNQSLSKAEKRAQEIKGSLNFFNFFSSKKIDSTLPMILELHYADGVIEKRITNIPTSFAGLTEKQLRSVLNDWKLKEYNSDEALILKKNISDVSPEGKNYYHIGIKDNRVAIFYGKQGNMLKQLTEINVNKLPVEETRILQNGIVVKNKEELLAILEGLKSIRED